MKRFPLYVFGGLIVATIAAFFITQHLKVTTPFIAGFPNPDPGYINPVDGTTCPNRFGVPVSHRFTRISFYLQNRSDDVNVYVVDHDGDIVDQVAAGVHMRGGKHPKRRAFTWNGRESDGTVAPDGTYHFHVALIHQGRAINIGGPITIKTIPPHPAVTSVSPSLIPQGPTPVTIRFTGSERQLVTVLIYRTDVTGAPRVAYSFETTRRHFVTWNGTIDGALAPAGTYLVGLRVTDLACNVGRFPVVLPPPPGSTPHAGLTVRYLAAQPPATPVQAGVRATVYVDSRTRPYKWTLAPWAAKKPTASGRGSGAAGSLYVRLPRAGPGLYLLSLRSGANRTAVPLVSNVAGRRPPILVVLPALTWEGQIAGDEDGDGIPDTLDVGVPVSLTRVFAAGLPPDLPAEATLLRNLTRLHLPYDLTTDVGLVEGDGPALGSYRGVVLAGTERWLPPALSTSLQSYVQHGGHVLSFGIDSMRRKVTVERTAQGAFQALDPTQPANPDALNANISAVTHAGQLILAGSDELGIFRGTSYAFPGFSQYQPIAPLPKAVSWAGPSSSSLAIAGYRLGSGFVVDVGIVGFGASIVHNVDAQELARSLWAALAR